MTEQPNISDLRSMIAELSETIALFARGIAPLKEQAAQYTDAKAEAYQEYLARVFEIDRQKKKTDEQMAKINRNIEATRRELEAKESMLDQMVSIEEAKNNMLTLEARWNKLTEDAPWRKFIMKHQQEGSDKMVFYRRLANCDLMGLGKTFQAISACDKVKAATSEGDIWYEEVRNFLGHRTGKQRKYTAPPAGRRILYLSPAELVRNVEPEWRKWAPHREPKVLSKRTKLQREIYMDIYEELKEDGEEYLLLCNYESWRKDEAFLDRLIGLGFDTVILDEAHVLKDRESNAYRGVRRLLDGYSKSGLRLAEPVRFVWPMTGTPFLNRPQEFYTVLTLVESDIFPNTKDGEWRFLTNYCENYDANKWRFRKGGIENLAKLISNRYLRRTLKDAGIDLPPQTIQYHELDIDDFKYPQQAKARQDFTEKAAYVLDADKGLAIVAPIMLTVYLRLRQIETWPAGVKLKDGEGNVIAEVDVYESQKMDYVLDTDGEGLLTEVCPDQRAVVLSQFNEPLHVLGQRAESAGIRSIVLDGSTSQTLRDEIKIDFDRTRCRENGRTPKWDVLFANYKVGGVGLNLTDATQMIALDEEWNQGKADQAFGRINRIGQTENTSVHVIRMNKTVDDWLARIIEEKANDQGTLVDAMGKQAFLDAHKKGEL